MPVPSIRVSSWSQLLDALYASAWNESLGRFRLPFAFRGDPMADEDLSSGLMRLAAGRPNVSRLELHLLRNFRKYAYGQAGTDTIWHWLALGQHRGLPTRLLDWTYSPFVALHFATQNLPLMDEDGSVWAFNFVNANRFLPRRLKRILALEGSDTVTTEMLAKIGELRDFDRVIAQSSLPVLVDYWAPWCGPCRIVAPEVQKVAARYAGRALVIKVNTDELTDVGQRFGIRSIPTLAVFAGGREITRVAGARPAPEIEALLQQAAPAHRS